MNPYQVSRDPVWHRWVDGLVILIIGLAAGLVLAQGLMIEEVTTTTQTIRSRATVPQLESGTQIDRPEGFKIEES